MLILRCRQLLIDQIQSDGLFLGFVNWELTKRIRSEEVCERLVNCELTRSAPSSLNFVSPLFPIPTLGLYTWYVLRAAITLCRMSCRLRRFELCSPPPL